jgi:hypothetical protein
MGSDGPAPWLLAPGPVAGVERLRADLGCLRPEALALSCVEKAEPGADEGRLHKEIIRGAPSQGNHEGRLHKEIKVHSSCYCLACTDRLSGSPGTHSSGRLIGCQALSCVGKAEPGADEGRLHTEMI